jgi:hypothetical protein
MPDISFPPYTFIPGRTPHPHSPEGHSYRVEHRPAEPIDPPDWRTSRAYLHGLDLFNAQFFWEAHESWEGLWLACGRRGPVAEFIKGLIHLTAAGFKHLEGIPAGVRSHATRAAELFRAVEAPVFMGLRIADLVAVAEGVVKEGWPATPPLLIPQ